MYHLHGYNIDLILCLHRLFDKELQYIVNHAKDDYIMLDLTFVDLMAKMQRKIPTVKGYIILADRQHMPKNSKLQNMLCYEDLLQVHCILCNKCNVFFLQVNCKSSFLGSATCNGMFCRIKLQIMFPWAVQAEVNNLPFRWRVQDENLACGLCYTSGTTGNPKVLTRPHPPCMAVLIQGCSNPHSLLGST